MTALVNGDGVAESSTERQGWVPAPSEEYQQSHPGWNRQTGAEGTELPGDKPAPQHAALQLIDPTTLHGLPVPPRRWLVPDWIPMARVTGLYGAGGEGKTLLAQMLATAGAVRKLWRPTRNSLPLPAPLLRG
jgi:AAA domain